MITAVSKFGGHKHRYGLQKPPALFRLIWCFLLLGLVALAKPGDEQSPTYKVGVLVDNYPFSYAADDQQIKGFVVDILAEIEAVTGLKLARRTGPTNEINGAFEAGELDMLQSYARSSEREKFAVFSLPYLRMSGCIFVRKDAPAITTLAELKGRRVLVHPGSKGEQVLRAAGLADSIVHVASVDEALRRLNAGEGDATLAGRLSGLATARRQGLHNIKPSSEPIYKTDYCFAVRKNHEDDLLRQIDEGLLIIQQPGGTYGKIYRKWFGNLGGYTSGDVMIAVTAGLGIALLVAIWAILRQRRLYRQIRTQATQLKTSEERYRGVFESTLDGILILQPTDTTNREFIVEQANPSAQRLFKTEALPWIGRHLSRLLPDGQALCTRIGESLAHPHSLSFEHECPSDTDPLWFRITVGRVGQRPLVVIANVTETRLTENRLKKHEEHLRQNQKLEAIGTLASGIAHDFNNILAAILGNAELATLDLPPDHPSRPCLEDIRTGSERARRLVRQILTFSRKSETRREIVSVSQIVGEALGFVSTTAPKSITFSYAPPAEPNEIEGDPTQLNQVFLNLLTNAVHAVRGREGRIDIEEELVEIDNTTTVTGDNLTPGRYIHVSVRDNGSGMPPEVMQRIFEPFYTTKPVGEGTGLGLSVVHGIIRSHQGEITVYSKPGQGTVFHIHIPAVVRPATPATTPGKVAHGGGQRVMVIDDEQPVIQATIRLLEKIGYVPTPFTDPQVALSEYRRNPGLYHAIICDLTMPALTGLDLAEVMAKDHPFILMSGYLSEDDKNRALQLNVCQVISKPLNMVALSAMLLDCITSRRLS